MIDSYSDHVKANTAMVDQLRYPGRELVEVIGILKTALNYIIDEMWNQHFAFEANWTKMEKIDFISNPLWCVTLWRSGPSVGRSWCEWRWERSNKRRLRYLYMKVKSWPLLFVEMHVDYYCSASVMKLKKVSFGEKESYFIKAIETRNRLTEF